MELNPACYKEMNPRTNAISNIFESSIKGITNKKPRFRKTIGSKIFLVCFILNRYIAYIRYQFIIVFSSSIQNCQKWIKNVSQWRNIELDGSESLFFVGKSYNINEMY